jgi:HSP20 family protein
MTMPTAIRPSQPHPERVEQRPPTIAPLVDVFENADELLLWADVPGATRESVDVHIEKGQLTLSARRAAPEPERTKKETPVSLEHRTYDYLRVFAVPSGIDASKIEAELVGGVLRVRLPKSEALKPRRIDVKAG